MPRKTKSKKTEPLWTLTFESGIKLARPTFARIVSGIENLQPDGDGNNWMILETTHEDGSLAGFMQTACVEPGLYIVEVNVTKSERDIAQWKAGRKEPAGAVISQGKKGLFKTYENEHLSTDEVINIAEYFFSNQQCHPDFQWRSIREDVKANQRSRK